MRSTEEYERLEQEELEITNDSIKAVNLVIANAHGSIENALRSFYQKYGKDGVVTYAEARKWVNEQDHRRRLTALSALILLEFGSIFSQSKGIFSSFLTSIVGKENAFFGLTIDSDKILNKPWGADDSTWLERLENDVNIWNVRIVGDIKRAILQRKNLDEVLAILTKRFGSIEAVVRKLGLSESTAIGSLARQEIFKELGIKKYKFYTKPDERRCETCGAMHGLIFPMSVYEVGSTASPLHPHCRCWEVPITE